MAFPTTGILDNFNRADENPLVGATGTEWGDRNTNDDLSIETNLVRGQTVGTLASRYWAAATFGPDCEAYCSVNHTPNTAADYIRLWARIQNPGAVGETGYMMQWSNNTSGARLFVETARETFTQLAQNASARYADGDVIGIELIGTSFKLYQNGTSILSVTDGTISLAGNIALGGRGTSFRWDDFGGGTIAGAAAAKPKTLMTLGVG